SKAVRALTCTLLMEDFGLTIDIPLERLIPTDLVGGQGEPCRGIDIGTGASCIYPLLGASMNGWHYLVTEIDDICFDYATRNVEQNNLSDLIKVPQKTLLMDALKSAIVYNFCICKPPLFANQLEAKGVNSRNSRRPPPSSVNTGGVTEIMVKGGELEFVKRIIHDSLQLKTRLWYSCMLGKKCSLAPLKEELRHLSEWELRRDDIRCSYMVPKVNHTEFCQGRTMLWALAPSSQSPPSKERKLEKSRKPLSFMLLQSQASSIDCRLKIHSNCVICVLQVLHKRVPCGRKEQSLFLTAVENTWIHRRQRPRPTPQLPRAPPSGTSTTLSSATAQHPQSLQHSTTHIPYSSHSDLHSHSSTGARQCSTPQSPSVVQHFLFKCLVNVKAEEQDVANTLLRVVAKPLGI
uniref:U6 small nuclear RNA (adenine-(43)-N(6))-methyltransferase n=1 Tax=Oncorhynchus tshawytscha TaxID=74940 RepID=A0A8C8IZL1_ONCTS